MRIGAVQLAAMLAALLMSAGLVLRISATLTPVAPETRSDTAAKQAIQIRDGAQGVTLFDDTALAPGGTAVRCLTVRATGTRTPDEVLMEATSSIDPILTPWLRLSVSRGPALGDGRTCDGFVSHELMAGGPAASVLASLEDGLSWQPSPGEEIAGGHGTTYELRAVLLADAPDDVQGARMDFDLTWRTEFDAAGNGVLDQGIALAVRFTEDSMIPMLAILAVAILFLGVQDRLDSATPRLSTAALFDEIVEFSTADDADDADVPDVPDHDDALHLEDA